MRLRQGPIIRIHRKWNCRMRGRRSDLRILGPELSLDWLCALGHSPSPQQGLSFPVDHDVFRMLSSWCKTLARWSLRWTPTEISTLVPPPDAGYSSPLHQAEAARWPVFSPAGPGIHSQCPCSWAHLFLTLYPTGPLPCTPQFYPVL